MLSNYRDFFFHFENGLTRRLFGLMMCDHFFSFNLFQVFLMAKPLCCSLSAMLLVSRVFLNSPHVASDVAAAV